MPDPLYASDFVGQCWTASLEVTNFLTLSFKYSRKELWWYIL